MCLNEDIINIHFATAFRVRSTLGFCRLFYGMQICVVNLHCSDKHQRWVVANTTGSQTISRLAVHVLR